MKVVYKDFMEFRRRFKNDRRRIDKVKRELREVEREKAREGRERAVTNKENKDVSGFFEKVEELSARTEGEIYRRILFNRKMNFLQSLGDKLSSQEHALRKAFVHSCPAA